MANSRDEVEKQLIKSFKELVMTTPVDKITIKEITDGAGVIRTTFYNHFQDKYEVIERILWKEIIDPARPLLDNDMVDETFVLIFKNVEKDKLFYQKLTRMEGQNSFEQIVIQCIRKLLEEYMEARMSPEGKKLLKRKYRWMTVDLIAEYYARAMTFVVMTWLQNGVDTTPEGVAQVYEDILRRSLDDILEELC
ncbi:MAG: TetR/AcrR family transcriptional regulator C-terminal domain-containing protein [Lachnospiraceae bacterium]|nr:TetR/AcrR family transcriptional regulator C-terminal domain-containing protein [Lachnospiraceae bacterium]